MGRSGCGKSTIASLILRLYDPDKGRILLDGVDIRELDPVWLRSHVGYVSQVSHTNRIEYISMYKNAMQTKGIKCVQMEITTDSKNI